MTENLAAFIRCRTLAQEVARFRAAGDIGERERVRDELSRAELALTADERELVRREAMAPAPPRSVEPQRFLDARTKHRAGRQVRERAARRLSEDLEFLHDQKGQTHE